MSAPWGLPNESGQYATWGLPAGHANTVPWGLPASYGDSSKTEEHNDPTFVERAIADMDSAS